LKVDEGDKVVAGQVIGLLDTRTLELQAEQAEAQAEVQKQMLLRLQNGSRPEEISQAQSQLKSQEAEVSRTEKDLARLNKLQEVAKGAVSLQDIDHAKANAQAAKAKAAALRETVRLAEIGPREEDVAGAEAQLKASEAQIALLRHQIEQGKLVAPTDAVVRSRLLEPGDMIPLKRLCMRWR
jgi:HlyD family secretion protein